MSDQIVPAVDQTPNSQMDSHVYSLEEISKQFPSNNNSKKGESHYDTNMSTTRSNLLFLSQNTNEYSLNTNNRTVSTT